MLNLLSFGSGIKEETGAHIAKIPFDKFEENFTLLNDENRFFRFCLIFRHKI